MLMHFNDTRMGIEVGFPFFRDWNSDQKLFEEIISCINACRLLVEDQISIKSRKSLNVFALFVI